MVHTCHHIWLLLTSAWIIYNQEPLITTKQSHQSQKQFFFDLQHLKMVLANTSEILTNQIDLSSKLREEVDNLHSSILALIQGKLTPTFLPEFTLNKTIGEIRRVLSKTQPNFYNAQTQIPWYKQHADFFYARMKHSLYITVKFPITSHKELLRLYKVISYPIPINSTASYATNILHLLTYMCTLLFHHTNNSTLHLQLQIWKHVNINHQTFTVTSTKH